jgi:hypothetical protein
VERSEDDSYPPVSPIFGFSFFIIAWPLRELQSVAIGLFLAKNPDVSEGIPDEKIWVDFFFLLR